MSQSFSWIDPSAFSAALTRAGFDAERTWNRQPPPPLRVAMFGAPAPAVSPQSSAAAMPMSPMPRQAPPAAPAPAATSTAGPPHSNGTAPEAQKPSKLTLDSPRLDLRLTSYMEWVEQNTGCKGLFIVDEEGLVLMEQESDPNLVALSAYFLNLKDRIPDNLGTRSEGSIAVDLDDERVLHVVQADTHLGPHALGFTVKSPLNRDTTQAFQEMLSLVFAQT